MSEAPPPLYGGVTEPDLRRQRKLDRERARRAHPFGRHLDHDQPRDLYDDEAQVAPVVVAFSGHEELLGGSAPVDVFDAFADLCVRRIYVRNLIGHGHHSLGSSLDGVVASMRALLTGHQPQVFIGTSMGGYLALVMASLLRVPYVIAINPTTTLSPEHREEAGDERWPEISQFLTSDLLGPFADVADAWRSGHFAPEVQLHFSYRNDVLRFQAEHVAAFPNVHLNPHFEYLPMPKIRGDGTLRRQLADMTGQQS